MDHRQAEVGIGDANALAAVAFNHQQAPVDLRPPVHPGRILLPDEAALGEADAIQFGGIAFEPQQVAELGRTLAHPKPQAMLAPVRCRFVGRRDPASAEIGEARIGDPVPSCRRPVHR